jgi:hypothetical protein
MLRLDASTITLRSTSLLLRWLAAASTMPAKIVMKILRATLFKCGHVHSGMSKQFSAEHVGTN